MSDEPIRGFCKTNIDEYKHEEWPRHFVAVPRRGEWMRAKSGKVLTVVMVTHAMRDGAPIIEVELHRGI